MGNNSIIKTAGSLWRKIVVFAAKTPALSSPLMCMIVVAALVAGLTTTPSWEEALTGSVLSWAFKQPQQIASIIVLLGRILFSVASFTFFCRALQLCYPKYYEIYYDRTH